jgi:D-aminopeptidase
MRIWIFVILSVLSSIASSETLPDKEAAKKLAESVMKKVEAGKSAEALDLVKPYLIIPMSEFEVMKNQLAMQAPMIEQRFGETIGVELAEIEDVGESLMLVMYIQKFEKHLMRWKFYFYKPKDGWVLNTFNTDDKIQLMFNNI